MSQSDIKQELSTLTQRLNDNRPLTVSDIKLVITSVINILALNKKSVDALASDTTNTVSDLLASVDEKIKNLDAPSRQSIQTSLDALETSTKAYLATAIKQAKTDIEKATKAQNDRAFARLQTVIDGIKMPTNGKDGAPGAPGRDGSPDTPTEVRDKLETLKGDERLDVSAIKGWDALLKKGKGKVQQMIVGGFRFLEQLYDVSVTTANHRQDMLIQYNSTNSRYQDGVALTVSTTAPSSPQVNDIWIDIS